MSDQSLREALREAHAALGLVRTFVRVEVPTAAGTVRELDRVIDAITAELAANPAESSDAEEVEILRRALADARDTADRANELLGVLPARPVIDREAGEGPETTIDSAVSPLTEESGVLFDRDAAWEAVVKVRDAAARVANDADSWDIVDAITNLLPPILDRESLIGATADELGNWMSEGPHERRLVARAIVDNVSAVQRGSRS
ncbi:hypothetical protein ACFV9C_41810 [Kribbella sp. NPDC059898]|uniref:hypothetical protein n=1 Tax=Kribbella sp. NPDC059898 TaxID=3346995 RepID=UPI00364C79E3